MLEPVRNSAELKRILALPRRTLTTEQGAELACKLSANLRIEGGTRELRPWQALSIKEAYENDGLVCILPVGEGKTDIAYNLPYVMSAKRPLLLLPAKLKSQQGRPGKTEIEFGVLANHWISPRPPMQIQSYSAVSSMSGWDLIERFKPDLIIADEAHKLRKTDTALYDRMDQFFTSNPDCRFCALTGTIVRKSLRDFAHLFRWAFKTRSPLPTRWVDLEQWADALDLKVDYTKRQEVGSLRRLLPVPDWITSKEQADDWYETCDPSVDDVRSALADRIQQTPGIIIYDGSECDQPIYIRMLATQADAALNHAFHNLRQRWKLPDEHTLSDPLRMFASATELSCGFYYRQVDANGNRPPDWWLSAREDANAFVRSCLGMRHGGRILDTEGWVYKAFGKTAPELIHWRETEPKFKVISVPVWLSTSVIAYAAEWAQFGPGLIWVQHEAVGQAISALTGLPFYQGGGLDSQGNSIENHRKDQSAILSVLSNLEGRNLQYMNRNLLIAAPPSGMYVEQLFGRTHRSGQFRPVTFDWLVTARENYEALYSAIDEAGFVLKQQKHTQKILKASVDWTHCQVNHLEPRFKIYERAA